MANGKIDVEIDRSRAADVAGSISGLLDGQMRADPASTIAGVLAYLAAAANDMTRNDPGGADQLIGAWMGTARGMARRLYIQKPALGEDLKFGRENDDA